MKFEFENQLGWFKVKEGLEHGRGVVVNKTDPIPAGTPLNLFPKGFGSRRLPILGLSENMISHGVVQADNTIIVPHFDSLDEENYEEPGWFLNHSQEPNALHDPLVHPTLFLAATALQPGMEITIDYMYLREPNPKAYYFHDISLHPQYTLPDNL